MSYYQQKISTFKVFNFHFVLGLYGKVYTLNDHMCLLMVGIKMSLLIQLNLCKLKVLVSIFGDHQHILQFNGILNSNSYCKLKSLIYFSLNSGHYSLRQSLIAMNLLIDFVLFGFMFNSKDSIRNFNCQNRCIVVLPNLNQSFYYHKLPLP